MAALTNLGIVHTVISVVALGAGLVAVARDREIRTSNLTGQIYLWGTLGSAITGLFIFQHGGFGKPHVLSIMTIAFLAIGALAAYTGVFGRAGRYVQAIAFSSTVFFHFIPGLTETGTRLPAAKPWFTSPEDPNLQMAVGIVALIFAVLLALQIRMIRRRPR